MYTLALDTAAATGSIALLDGDRILEEKALSAPDGFGAVLFQEIRALLERHSLSIGSVDLFAGASGPGSFTGIRVGLAAIKGLAATLNRPAAGVSNLQGLAACGTGPLRRATVLDARRDEVYAAVYAADLTLVSAEVVTPFVSWLAQLPEREYEFIAADFRPFRECLAASRFASASIVDAQTALAGAIGRIAYAAARRGDLPPVEAIDANYVRRSDAELFWKDA